MTALSPIVRERRGEWVGWSGGTGAPPRTAEYEGVRMRPVSLSAHEITAFYHGFSNRTLWPLFHDAIRPPEFNHSWWRPYVDVNRRFARAAVKAAGSRGMVWVQDYHLMLTPAMVRELAPGLRVGFFLHIPFPPEELFEWLPWRTELLDGLLGADVVGFQTRSAAQNFIRLAKRYCDADGSGDELRYRGRRITVSDFPISIDFDWFDERSRRPDVIAQARAIRRHVGNERKLLLAVDRLDYTKGIDHRLSAYELLLERGDVSVDKCLLMQVAAPSREPVREYAEMRTQIDRAVGSINGEFSRPGRVAVHYFRRAIPREDLVAYYLAADVMLVTPLRDGMNLVAKEYVASRSDLGGALVLSEFAGAASEMRQALLVNPRDTDGMAEAILGAMRMSRSESKLRMGFLRSRVRRHDVHEWAQSFLRILQR